MKIKPTYFDIIAEKPNQKEAWDLLHELEQISNQRVWLLINFYEELHEDNHVFALQYGDQKYLARYWSPEQFVAPCLGDCPYVGSIKHPPEKKY